MLMIGVVKTVALLRAGPSMITKAQISMSRLDDCSYKQAGSRSGKLIGRDDAIRH